MYIASLNRYILPRFFFRRCHSSAPVSARSAPFFFSPLENAVHMSLRPYLCSLPRAPGFPRIRFPSLHLPIRRLHRVVPRGVVAAAVELTGLVYFPVAPVFFHLFSLYIFHGRENELSSRTRFMQTTLYQRAHTSALRDRRVKTHSASRDEEGISRRRISCRNYFHTCACTRSLFFNGVLNM